MTSNHNFATAQAIRHITGLTQTEFADVLGVARTTVRDWDRGAFHPGAAASRALTVLLERHTTDTGRIADTIGADGGVTLAADDSWHRGIAARLIATGQATHVSYWG